MGIEDRLREDLRRTARTATGADALPRTVASSTASPTGNEASSFRSRPSRSRWPPPWSRSCGSSSRFHWRSRPASRESDRALRRGKAVPALWSADAALAVLRSLALT
jgi:hypothetical protein